jgi:hypothetical protein
MDILKIGSAHHQDSSETAHILAAHHANNGKMHDDKKFVLTSPFLDNCPLAGIFVFKASMQVETGKFEA